MDYVNQKNREVEESYLSSLVDLRDTNKPMITMLSLLAEENIQHGQTIVDVIKQQISQVEPQFKLPILYLIDSIVKNVRGIYIDLFDQCIFGIFVDVFKKVNEDVRKKMHFQRKTWDAVFSAEILYALDVEVNAIDPCWPMPANNKIEPKMKQDDLLKIEKIEMEIAATRKEIDRLDAGPSQAAVVVYPAETLNSEKALGFDPNDISLAHPTSSQIFEDGLSKIRKLKMEIAEMQAEIDRLDAGPSHAGPSHAGPTHAGPTHAGPTHAGPTHAGPTHAGPSHAGPSHAGPSHVSYSAQTSNAENAVGYEPNNVSRNDSEASESFGSSITGKRNNCFTESEDDFGSSSEDENVPRLEKWSLAPQEERSCKRRRYEDEVIPRKAEKIETNDFYQKVFAAGIFNPYLNQNTMAHPRVILMDYNAVTGLPINTNQRIPILDDDTIDEDIMFVDQRNSNEKNDYDADEVLILDPHIPMVNLDEYEETNSSWNKDEESQFLPVVKIKEESMYEGFEDDNNEDDCFEEVGTYEDIQSPTQTTLITLLDDEIDEEEQQVVTIGTSKIKINLSKDVRLNSISSESSGSETDPCENDSSNIIAAASNLETKFEVKDSIKHVQFKRQPVVRRGFETSGLCSIM
ncbi:uncharacterized protein LOC116345060 [Contarinia nasturtii]|uniref:uncharacterized protein LOC116345060 n=1 Tax=Contarinia nasturtii TaxID=265458 RepID=UPI0012D41D90|nr:uncharacterized protein LOC116345060 [Contarinia nasturtii]